MSIDKSSDVVRSLAEAREKYRPRKTSGGDGSNGGPIDPMEQRVAALEKGQATIIGKLEEIGKSLEALSKDTSKSAAETASALKIIDLKIDNKAEKETLTRISGEIGARLVGVEKELASKASSESVGILKGAVDKLPTNIVLFGFVVTVFIAAGFAKKFGW